MGRQAKAALTPSPAYTTAPGPQQRRQYHSLRRPRTSTSTSTNTSSCFSTLTHVDASTGQPAMVDVGHKAVTKREARARCRVVLPSEVRKSKGGQGRSIDSRGGQRPSCVDRWTDGLAGSTPPTDSPHTIQMDRLTPMDQPHPTTTKTIVNRSAPIDQPTPPPKTQQAMSALLQVEEQGRKEVLGKKGPVFATAIGTFIFVNMYVCAWLQFVGRAVG